MIVSSPMHPFPGEDASSGLQQIPVWVPKLLNVPEGNVRQVRVDQESSSRRYNPYNSLLEYFAYHAVNHDLPVVPVNPGATDDPKSNARRVDGSLSSFFYAFPTEQTQRNEDRPRYGGPEGYIIEGDESDNEQDDTPPLKAALHLGFGTARVQVKGKDVGILHKAKGHPIPGMQYPTVFRELHLFAADTITLQELMDTVLEWDMLRNKVVSARSGRYNLYSICIDCGDAYWKSEGAKASRSLDSVILPRGMLDKIVADFKEFSANDTEEWYLSHGLPHRRSYLFYGPPGVGKTSTIRALAGALQLSACFLSLGDAEIGNSELHSALRNMPKKAMLVIEDIDALFNKNRISTNTSALTFSGLLNALDGLVSRDGTLTVMTTNHIEKLDAALVRAGRVDRKFEFKTPTHEQIVGLFKSFYPDAGDELATEFADKVFKRAESDATSIATLQEHFIFTRRKTARESVDCLNEFFTEFYPQSKMRQKPVKHVSTPKVKDIDDSPSSWWRGLTARVRRRSSEV